jgi:RNA polymerase primary sigma factor
MRCGQSKRSPVVHPVLFRDCADNLQRQVEMAARLSDPDDAVTIYLNEVGNVKPLAKDEEAKLFGELAGPGDWDEARETAARRLIEGHLAQVVVIAQKYSASGIPMLDLIQEGNAGLINAVKSFAKGPMGDFADYADTWIDDAIKKAFG